MSDIEAKPKRVLSDEHKAKMNEGARLWREEKKKAKSEADKAAGIETPKKDASETDTASTTSSKKKRAPPSPEHMAKMQEGLRKRREADKAAKAAGIETPKKEPKTKGPRAPRKVLTPKVWQALLEEVRRDLKVEFEDYIQSKLE